VQVPVKVQLKSAKANLSEYGLSVPENSIEPRDSRCRRAGDREALSRYSRQG